MDSRTGMVAARKAGRVTWMALAGALALGCPAQAETELFVMGTSMRHATVASATQIGHQELIAEGAYLLKNINKNTAGANRTYLANGSEAAWGDIVLEHTVGVQWESWLEFNGPTSFPAKGMDDTLVIEATYRVATTVADAGARYNIGLSGRTASNYNNVVFWPNVFATGLRNAAADAGATHTVRFEIQPLLGTATVVLDGGQIGQTQISGDALNFITADDLGFVRVYFQSASSGSGADNTPLGTTLTYTIDQVRVYRLGDGGNGGGGGGGGGGEEQTMLFSVGDAALHSTNPAQTEVGHSEYVEEGESTLKNVNQQKVAGNIRTVLAEGDSTAGYKSIQLIHKEAVQWNSWLEYQIPAAYPAAGAQHKVVFETKYTVATSDPGVNLSHAVGLAARVAGAYSNVIFLPDKMTMPFTPTAGVAGQTQVVKFVIEPALGKGTVLLNDLQVGVVTLTEPALGYITNGNLGFVRLYFKSSGAAGGTDGALLGATQTWTIDYVKAYILGTPVVVTPTVERVHLAVDQALYNALNPGQTAVADGGVIRQGEDDLRFNAGLDGVTASLANPTALGHHAVDIAHPVAVNGETHVGFDYPYDYPAKGRPDKMVFEVKAAVLKGAGASGLKHGMTLSAKALNAAGDTILAPGTFGVLPRATSDSHSTATTYRFEIDAAAGVASAYEGTTLLQQYTLPADKAELLRAHDLTDVRLHLHGGTAAATASGTPLGATQTFRIDAARAYQRAALITQQQVKDAFTASGLNGTHPRVLATAAGLALVNQIRLADPMASNLFATVITAANDLSSKTQEGAYVYPPRAWGLDEANLRIPNIHSFHNPVGNLGVAYGLTGEARYAERVWAQIEMMNNDYPDFGASRHFLDTGVAAANYAIACDFLHGWLTPAQKTAMWEALKAKALIPARNEMRANSWWHKSEQNWNAVIHGGVIMAALAFYEMDPDLNSELITLAANGFMAYIDEFFPEGATEEGASYWGYGLSYFGMGIEAMLNVLGTDFGLSDSLGIERTRYFPMLISGPVATLNFGDDGIKGEVGETLLWLAKRFDDGALLRGIYESWQGGRSGNWRDLLWFRPDQMAGASTGPSSLENNVRGQDMVSLIESWTDSKAMFVAIHGGYNDASHGHLDAGSFYIQAGGTYFAFGNLGPDDYTSPGFFTNTAVPAYTAATNITTQGNQSRWHFYNTRAEGKNTLVFKPRATPSDVRPDQDPAGFAIVKDIQSHADESSAVLNLKPAYSRDVSHYERGIRLWNNRRTITVQDEFVPLADSTVWWGMHTSAPVLLSNGNRTARLVNSRGSLIVSLRSPANATFKLMSPLAYLPGEAFPQTDNREIPAGMKKLQIQLEADTGQSQMIRVDFRIDSNAEALEQWPQPLAEWGTQAGWPDTVSRQEAYALSSWMGWYMQGPGGWVYSVATGSWFYSIPNNQKESFFGWSPARGAWFWTSAYFWPWTYVYDPVNGGWTYAQTGAL